MAKEGHVGVILTGGGARGAYQAGVLKAVCEITGEMGIKNPFSILSGISVGAINTAYLAAHADDIQEGTARMVSLWESIQSKDVIKTNPASLTKIALRWLLEMTTGGIIKRKKARALLDNSPLISFIEKEVPFYKIQQNIDQGNINGVVITAVNYNKGVNCNFFQCNKEILPWKRVKRVAIHTEITKEHVMASTALPLYFPPQKIGSSYFADGNLRNNTPLSPAIKLGADKLLIIPIRKKPLPGEEYKKFDPTLGRMVTVLLNALFYDAVDFDIERLSRVNETISHIKDRDQTDLRTIQTCIIRPSEDVGQIACEEARSMPPAIRHLIAGLGSVEETQGIISILLFEASFTKRLTRLGYSDAMNQKEKIIHFYKS